MSEAGLEPRIREIHSEDHQLGYLSMKSILSPREPVTAVFAGSDQIARGVYEAVRQAGLLYRVMSASLVSTTAKGL